MRIGNPLEGHLVEVGELNALVVLLPIVRVLVDDDFATGLKLGNLERSGTDGVEAVADGILGDGSRRRDEAHGGGQVIDEADIWLGQGEDDGGVILLGWHLPGC